MRLSLPSPAQRATAAVGLVGALLLTACGAEETTAGQTPAAESSAGSGDGELVVYSGRSEDLVAPLIAQFEDASGIDVDVRYGSTGEQAALLAEEGGATPAQVFLSQDAGALGALSRAGLFAPLPEEITSAVLPGFTSEDGSWVGVTGRARVIAYDSVELTEDQVPDTVAEIATPEWAPRTGIAPSNASFQSFVTAYRVIEGEDAAAGWLEDVVDGGVQAQFDGNGAIVTEINEGRLDLGLINHYYWYETAAEIGEENMRMQLKYPEPGDPGAIVNVTGAAVLAGAEQDPDALAFVEYLVSEEGQAYFVENTYEYPLVPGVEAPPGLPDLESLRTPELDLSDLDSLEETTAMLTSAGLL